MKIDINHMMGTASFFVNLEASASKTTYKGLFTVKCVLSPMEYIHANSLYRELLGKTNPQFASEYVSNLCYALSELKFRIIDSPAWFKSQDSSVDGSNIEDNILLFILDKAVSSEETYRKDMEEKAEAAKQAVIDSIDDGSLTNEEELNDIDDEEEKEEKFVEDTTALGEENE